MEVHPLFPLLPSLKWRQTCSGRVTRDAWDKLGRQISTLTKQASEVQAANWERQDPMLERTYQETLRELAGSVTLLVSIAPDIGEEQGKILKARQKELEQEIELLWAVLETGPHQEAQQRFRKASQELIITCDLIELVWGEARADL